MVLRFIEQQIAQNGFPPTIREIGQSLGIRSTNGVNDHLKSLQRKGYIFRQGQKSRTLKLMKSSDDVVLNSNGATTAASASTAVTMSIPLFLDIAKIQPGFRLDEASAVIPFPAQFFFFENNAPLFAIKVSSNDKLDNDIQEGDWLFAQQSQTAPAGSRVLIRTASGLIVRRYFPEGDRVRFQPEQDFVEPLFVSRDAFASSQILGIVLGVFRRYE